jgi:hypothetical protein
MDMLGDVVVSLARLIPGVHTDGHTCTRTEMTEELMTNFLGNGMSLANR